MCTASCWRRVGIFPRCVVSQPRFLCNNSPVHDDTSLSARIAIGLMAVFFILGAGTGYQVAGHRGVTGAVGNVSQPEGVDFSPVWKAWHIIDEKFVSAAVASSPPYAAR